MKRDCWKWIEKEKRRNKKSITYLKQNQIIILYLLKVTKK